VVEKRVEPVDLSDEGTGQRQLDLLIFGGDRTSGNRAASTATLDVEPATVVLPQIESIPVAYIQIVSYPDRELVTSIEVLSPGNKNGSSRGDYLAKRMAVLETKVNLVEIDLLLAGRRPAVIGAVPPGEYVAFVSRGDQRPKCQAYAWSIRRTLPRLPIPLKSGDDDAVLDLAAAYQMTYDGGPYPLLLSYERLKVELPEAEQEWAVGRIASRNRPIG
jgi:hypothetical protein